MEIRLNKMLSDAGLCSRREADEYIKEGRVRVNDDLPRVGQKVTENDKVTFDDIIVNISKQSIRKANSEAATKPKLSDNKKKEIISSEIKIPGIKSEKRSGLRPGKYGKYNKYAAARAHAREIAAAEDAAASTGESRKTRGSRTQQGRTFEKHTEKSSHENSAESRPQRERTRQSRPQEDRSKKGFPENRPESRRPQRPAGRNNRIKRDR